jgi:hypothetical protein
LTRPKRHCVLLSYQSLDNCLFLLRVNTLAARRSPLRPAHRPDFLVDGQVRKRGLYALNRIVGLVAVRKKEPTAADKSRRPAMTSVIAVISA